MESILGRIARRYELKGCLSGTMKVGQNPGREEMAELGNFFGLDPLRINAKEEVRLYFDKLLQNGSEEQWLEKIGASLGCSLKTIDRNAAGGDFQKLLARLSLAYPDLEPLFVILTDDGSLVRSMPASNSEKTVGNFCFQTAETISFLLANREPITVSELGARFYYDSKALRQGELRRLFLGWLRLLNPDSEMLEDEDLLTRYHVLHDRLTVNAVLYGPVIYEKNGKVFDWIDQLYQQGEAATVGWSNIQEVDRMYFRDQEGEPPDLICCENEAPFSRLMREKQRQCLLFTSGFPGSTVQKIYQLLAPRAAACFHWGDSDPAGLRIAAIMHALHPLTLYRCNLTTLQDHKHCLLSLTQKQQNAAMHILLSQADFPFAEELLFTLENGWLEQESRQG